MANEKALHDLADGVGLAAWALGDLAQRLQQVHTQVEQFVAAFERALHPGSAPDAPVAEGGEPVPAPEPEPAPVHNITLCLGGPSCVCTCEDCKDPVRWGAT